MVTPDSIVGLPRRSAENLLRAAAIPYTVVVGDNFNNHFSVADEGYYVGRVRLLADGATWEVLVYRPMIASGFEDCKEVQYAKEVMAQADK